MINSWEVRAEHGATLFVEQHRAELSYRLAKIEHCFNQLSEEDVWWRPYESHNALGNIIVHLCGNMRQWLINGVQGAPDVRDRPAEFATRETISSSELMAILRQTIEEADAVLASLLEGGAEVTVKKLMEVRRVQGFDVHVQAAIQDSVSHLGGHTQEIIWITRLRVGEQYQFFWKPQTPEQGAPD